MKQDDLTEEEEEAAGSQGVTLDETEFFHHRSVNRISPPHPELTNCSKGLSKDFIEQILEIDQREKSIVNARPSNSLYSSQEDLSQDDAEESNKPEINDVSKLKEEQRKTIDRAKAMLCAAFSEEEESDNDEDPVKVVSGRD